MTCLDTSYVVDYLRGRKEAKEIYVKYSSQGEILSIPSPVIMELAHGAYQSNKKEEEIKKIKDFIISLNIYDFDEDVAWKAGEVEALLRKRGDIIEPEDIMIASICIVNNETLITRNKKHFEKIQGLKIESY